MYMFTYINKYVILQIEVNGHIYSAKILIEAMYYVNYQNRLHITYILKNTDCFHCRPYKLYYL